jgi:hypothetical protein
MPISRKPPPPLAGLEEPPTGGSSEDTPNEDMHRLTLTDDLVKLPSSYGEIAYDQLDEAVTLMQQRFPDDASVAIAPAPIPNDTPPYISNVALPVPVPEMSHKDSYASSQHTVYNQDAYYYQEAAEQQQVLEGDGFAYHQPVPVAPRLPTIDSGLPIQWDLGDGQDASDPFLDHPPPQVYKEPNPFHDLAAPVSSLPPDRMESVDSFQYDPERYGSYARTSYLHTSISRSPTPSQSNEYDTVNEKDTSGYTEQLEDVEHDHVHPNDLEKMFTPGEPPTNTKHFGPAPTGRVLRRHKTKKRVPLTAGNLVTHIDVPTKLVLPRKGEPEMMQTRCVSVDLSSATSLIIH